MFRIHIKLYTSLSFISNAREKPLIKLKSPCLSRSEEIWQIHLAISCISFWDAKDKKMYMKTLWWFCIFATDYNGGRLWSIQWTLLDSIIKFYKHIFQFHHFYCFQSLFHSHTTESAFQPQQKSFVSFTI